MFDGVLTRRRLLIALACGLVVLIAIACQSGDATKIIKKVSFKPRSVSNGSPSEKASVVTGKRRTSSTTVRRTSSTTVRRTSSTTVRRTGGVYVNTYYSGYGYGYGYRSTTVLSVGGKVGIAVGVITFVLLIAVITYCVRRSQYVETTSVVHTSGSTVNIVGNGGPPAWPNGGGVHFGVGSFGGETVVHHDEQVVTHHDEQVIHHHDQPSYSGKYSNANQAPPPSYETATAPKY